VLLRYLGHACFDVVPAAGPRVLLDPYRSGALGGRISHAPIDVTADIVAITHYHEDHGWYGALPGDPIVVDQPGQVLGVDFRMVWLPHDAHDGCRMGISRMIAFTVDGVSVLHPGDLGRLPTRDELRTLGRVDLLLLPIGGKYTLGTDDAVELMRMLRPRWTVPMHYRSKRVDLDMAPRAAFVARLPSGIDVHGSGSAELDCAAPDCPDGVILLDPAL